jgi:outer membrane protein OmpA-like peptidoglycan-associated protein
MTRIRGVVAMIAVLALTGCSAMRHDKYCKWALPAWGAALGGVGAGLGVSEGSDGADAAEIGGAAAGGIVVGGLLGWAAGHYLCEEEKPAPPPAAPPPPPPPPPAPRKIETLSGPSFEFNKATLTAEGRSHLDHAVQLMKANPSMHVVVEGHTDSVGTHEYNMKLSERRADAARDYMIEKGISAGRIRAAWYGETRPVASNATAAGRAKNRRVDVVAE